MENIVKNNSKGYGYNYASLSDVALQGFEIPKMKVETDPNSLKDYVYYYDKEFKEWFRGAEIVIPDSKGMNKAQLYGSALTYARRYSVYMALGLVCDEDTKIEELKADGTSKKDVSSQKDTPKQKATKEQVSEIELLLPTERITKLLAGFKINSLAELDYTTASKVILKERKAQEEQ